MRRECPGPTNPRNRRFARFARIGWPMEEMASILRANEARKLLSSLGDP
jgi:hypothetical protein